MDRYITAFILNRKKYYCIWYTDDFDGFETKDNKLIYFLSLEDLYNYCNINNIVLKDEEVIFDDINFFIDWLNNNIFEVDCNLFLNFWNTVGDVANSIKEDFYGNEDGKQNEILDVYNRLFYGCNLEVMRGKDGEMYYPKWDEEDMQIIKSVVIDGIRILKKALNINLKNEYKLID